MPSTGYLARVMIATEVDQFHHTSIHHYRHSYHAISSWICELIDSRHQIHHCNWSASRRDYVWINSFSSKKAKMQWEFHERVISFPSNSHQCGAWCVQYTAKMISLILFNVVFLFAIYSVYRYMFSRPKNFPPGNRALHSHIVFKSTTKETISRATKTSVLRQLLVHVDIGSEKFAKSGHEIVRNLQIEYHRIAPGIHAAGDLERQWESAKGAQSSWFRWKTRYTDGTTQRTRYEIDW